MCAHKENFLLTNSYGEKTKPPHFSKTYWTRLIKHAVKRNLEFEISINYAWELFQNQNEKCALSGRNIKLNRQYSQNNKLQNKQTASLDRIDSKQGYCVGNVQWVHLILNRMKSNLEEKEFLQWCQDVASHKISK